MTQEDKQLLLKDLCARLPYGVMMGNKILKETSYRLSAKDIDDAEFDDEFDDVPYLRPMSSMTEEDQSKWIKVLFDPEYSCSGDDWLLEHHFDIRHLIEKGLALEAPEGMYET